MRRLGTTPPRVTSSRGIGVTFATEQKKWSSCRELPKSKRRSRLRCRLSDKSSALLLRPCFFLNSLQKHVVHSYVLFLTSVFSALPMFRVVPSCEALCRCRIDSHGIIWNGYCYVMFGSLLYARCRCGSHSFLDWCLTSCHRGEKRLFVVGNSALTRSICFSLMPAFTNEC